MDHQRESEACSTVGINAVSLNDAKGQRFIVTAMNNRRMITKLEL